MLTKDQVLRFYEEGYLIVKQVFQEHDLRMMRDSLENVMRKVSNNPEGFRVRYTQISEKERDSWGVDHVVQPELYEESFNLVLENPKMFSILERLIGKDIRYWGIHALWSPEKVDYDWVWHRDAHLLHSVAGRPLTHVQFNIALNRDECFRVVPGSHLRPLTEEEVLQLDKGISALPGEVVASCEAGDILLMNAWTIHRGSSKAGSNRRTLHCSMQPKDYPFGGNCSPDWMRNESNLNQYSPRLREIMQNIITWDDINPVNPRQLINQIKMFLEDSPNLHYTVDKENLNIY
nr:phytanoyl-CoA dioxygenase family protein [Paenibacillus xylanexedens]